MYTLIENITVAEKLFKSPSQIGVFERSTEAESNVAMNNGNTYVNIACTDEVKPS